MSDHIDIIEKYQKEEDKFQKNNTDNNSTRRCYEDADENESERQQTKFSNSLKKYSRYDLLLLRNGQLSTHYPHCALRPELQALSIWTCRLRCELQYLGLWKIPNTGNPYGSCSCNGTFQSYTCENGGQSYASLSAPAGSAGGSHKYYVNSQQQSQHHTASSSPTLGSKRAVRSRERSLNYQRCINVELVRGTSPGGICDQPTQHNLSHHTKTPFIDHRSISSSHLMPAFAKRKMSHTNPMYSHVVVCSNFNNNGHNSENLSNEDCGESANHFETSLKSRKESIKNSNNQNDFHLYRQDKNDQFVDGQTGWMMNAVKKIYNDYSPSNNKISNTLSGINKKMVYERRIGSGRLVPRDVNWEMRGGKKEVEKENNNASQNSILEKNKDFATSGEVDKLNIKNSSSSRYLDGQERRIFDRRITNADESTNSAGSNNNKRYTSSTVGDDTNNFESNYHHQQNFTGQRSMSFRRREYIDHRDSHREFRDFREQKESREPRDRREPRGGEPQQYHNKDEPEWFSEGPTSQHDTIELRGFEESDESSQQILINKYSKFESKNSVSSLLSHNSSSNKDLSTRESAEICSVEIPKNLSNSVIMNNFEKNDNISTKETTPNNEDVLKGSSDTVEFIADTEQNHSKPKQLNEEGNRQSNETELFFDNFLNIEAFENSLIGNVNDQTISNNDLNVGGTSRFSRWFFNNSNNQNNSDEYNNNPPTKDDPQRFSKDLNECEFNSIMTFLKCNNIPTSEIPKSLPSNVSALSVKELEARMRKMDTGEKRSECNNESDVAQMKMSENERTFPQSVDINSQDVEAFRKLLDQLGKPRVDISMNIILPNSSGHPLQLTNSVSVMSPSMTALPPNVAIAQSSMTKQEYAMKVMHQQHVQQQQHQQHFLSQQQNVGKMVVPHVHHQGLTQISPHQQSSENLSLMPVPHHHHLMPMILGQPQKRLDVQHLYQSVVRDELSRSFLEKELKNPNCPSYAKEIISTVLKETSRLNAPSGSQTNLSRSASTETPIPANEHPNAPSNLMQSLARGEVSLNHLEQELNKLNNIGIISEASANSAKLKDGSLCVTPSTVSLNTAPIITSASVIQLPPSSQVVLAQQQNSIITNENVATISSDQHQTISSMIRSHNEDPSIHIPTQRELKMHTHAIMQNAIFKKKLEVEQHEQRRRQEMHKQHELESSNQQHQQQSNVSMSQQVHHSSRHINSPTPLAFTPTSVLRKMTAEKESTSNSSQTTTISSTSSQQIQQQANLKLKLHQQINNQHSTYQHPNQPRMILGGGNFQYMNNQHHHILSTTNGSPQISPQQKAQIRNQPPVPVKWTLITHSSMDSNQSLLNNISNKPMGRPILKGPGPIVPQTNHNSQCQNQSSVNQNSQPMQTVNPMQKYPPIQHHQQQPRQIVGQQLSTHMLQHQIPSSQQNSMQHQQLFQQQRSVVMHRNQIQQSDLGNHGYTVHSDERDVAIGEEMDELMEDIAIICSLRRGDVLRVPKSINWRENVLCCFDDGRFLQMLRVTKYQFARLVNIIIKDDIFKDGGQNLQLPIDLQLAIVLYRLGSSGVSASVRKIATIFGVGDGGTLAKITGRIFSAILRKLPEYINWPNATERRKLVSQTFSELPYCIGYIDGSEIKLAEKPYSNHDVYFSRQRIYSIKLQVVCDHKLRILHADVGSPGSYHDSKVFKKSTIGTNTANLFSGEEWIAGDSAYQLSKHLITPYRSNSNLMDIEKQVEFNKRHSLFRVRVEHCFGILKSKFCSLKEMRVRIKDRNSQVFFNKWVLVCCVLHNILLEERDDSQIERECNEMSEGLYDKNDLVAPTPELKRNALYSFIFE